MLGDTVAAQPQNVVSNTRFYSARPRKRKAWEFSWDDFTATGEADSPALKSENLMSADAGENLATSVKAEIAQIMRVRRRPRRATRKTNTTASSAVAASVTSEPGSSSVSCSANTKAFVLEDPVLGEPSQSDIEEARRRLNALGSASNTNERESGRAKDLATRDTRVVFVRTRKGTRPVQVFSKTKAANRTTTRNENVLKEPLVERVVDIVSMMNKNDGNTSALRKAVKELRNVLAGLETRILNSRRTEIPLIRQAYDPKTMTG